MKRSLPLWQLMGFAVTSLLGTLFHFLYEWTNQSTIAALVSGVNESTWEHMKLLFFPMFFYGVVQSRFFKERRDFWCVKTVGITTGILLIPVLFYTYNGAFGKSPDFINIAFFFVAAAVSYLLETRLYKNGSVVCKRPWILVVLLIVIAALFVIFTFLPPKIPLFADPLTGTYGIQR